MPQGHAMPQGQAITQIRFTHLGLVKIFPTLVPLLRITHAQVFPKMMATPVPPFTRIMSLLVPFTIPTLHSFQIIIHPSYLLIPHLQKPSPPFNLHPLNRAASALSQSVPPIQIQTYPSYNFHHPCLQRMTSNFQVIL